MKDLDQFVTDETLAAYIDGNAFPIERNIINNLSNNEELQEILGIVSDINNNPEIVEKTEGIYYKIPDNIEDLSESLLHELKKGIEKTNNNNII